MRSIPEIEAELSAAPPVEYAGLVERLRVASTVTRGLVKDDFAEAADAITALEARARDAEARIRELEAASLIHIRTGVFDRDGREIEVGDHIRIDITSPNTKEEYWRPEYEVVWRAPTFDLQHIGGDRPSRTAEFRFHRPHPSHSTQIGTIRARTQADAPAQPEGGAS